MDRSGELLVWADGRVGPVAEQGVPLLDHGFLFGDGVFEGIRVTPRGIFRFDDHLRRLETGLRAVGIALPGGIEDAARAARETTRAWGRRAGYLRLIVTRGEGSLGIDPASCRAPRVLCLAAARSPRGAGADDVGVRLATASWRRPGPDVLDPRVKSLNYLNNVLVKREANLRGVDDGLVLNGRGLVAEASSTNVFAIRDEALWTPPPSDGALAGITRRTILELARARGVATFEASLGRFDLLDADAVFLTGSAAGIVPVAELDGAALSRVGRPLLEALARDFEERLDSLSVDVHDA